MEHTARPKFVICIRNTGAEDLELRKVYRVLLEGSSDGYLHIVDESGEGYLYPAGFFILLDLPPMAEQALLNGA